MKKAIVLFLALLMIASCLVSCNENEVTNTSDVSKDESEEMLDLIFDNKKFDMGAIYNFGGLADMFSQLASTGWTDIASKFESISQTVEEDIEDTITNFGD